MEGHTPEPWLADGCELCFSEPNEGDLCLLARFTGGRSEDGFTTYDPFPNATRAAACVNACIGINPESVPDMLAALLEARDTLKLVADPSGHGFLFHEEIRTVEAAIAKAEEPTQ